MNKFQKALMFCKQKSTQVGIALGTIAVSTGANAAIDTTAVISAITDAGTAVGVVGAAALVVVIISKTYKWVRSAA